MYIAYGLPAVRRYRTFQIPKKNGTMRDICAPTSALLLLQQDIKNLLEKDYNPRAGVHGFVSGKGRGIVTNAEQHIGKKWVLNVDLKDYFESIHFGRIYGRLQAKPYSYSKKISQFIAHISCYETFKNIDGQKQKTSVLMQGGALSPILSNIVSDKIDGELSRMCIQFGCSYTRYADDITISSRRKKFPRRIAKIVFTENTPVAVLSEEIQEIIEGNGFTINRNKTRILDQSIRQEVTGLVVNRKLNVPRTFIRQIRSMLHDWEKNGYDKAAEHHFKLHRKDRGRLPEYEASSFDWVVRGKIEFVRHVKGSTDQVFQKLAEKFNCLTDGKEFSIPIIEEISEIQESVWYLEAESQEKNGDPEQGYKTTVGTAFCFSENYFITCSHCLGEKTQIFPKKSPKIAYEVEVVYDDKRNDLAIFKVRNLPEGFKSQAELSIASNPEVIDLKVLDVVQLAGFPDNNNEEQVTIHQAQISRFSSVSFNTQSAVNQNSFVLDKGVFAGMSGGPVLHNGKVVAVITRGPNTKNHSNPHQAVKITYLLEEIAKFESP